MQTQDLSSQPYFAGISATEIESLVARLDRFTHEAGATLLFEGATSPGLYIVTQGRLSIAKRTKAGEDRTLATLQAPTLFGELELFCGIPAVASVRGDTETTGYLLTRPRFDELFKARHDALLHFTFNVARVACQRLATADGLLANALPSEHTTALQQVVFGTRG